MNLSQPNYQKKTFLESQKENVNYLSQFAEFHKISQEFMIKHELKLHTESMEFQAKFEQDGLMSEMTQRLQQQAGIPAEYDTTESGVPSRAFQEAV